MKRRIASHFALIDGRLERDRIVEVDERGTITAIEHCTAIDSRAGVEFYPGILIPGMVNAHAHLELAYLRGAIAEETGFAGFARAIGQVRGNYTTEERVRAARVADAMMWQEGVQAVADIANDDLIMELKEQSAIEYHTLFEHFGLRNNDTAPLEALAARYNNATVTPHSTYSVAEAPFRTIVEQGTTPLSVHFLESDDEHALYQHAGSLWTWYERMGWECDFLHYDTAAKRITACVPPERRLMLVHATRATATDVATINDHFTTPATWVLCPESNRYISRLEPPLEMLRAAGCAIAIGTDSLASARHMSMVENMRMLGAVPLEELLSYATINGARALGIDDRIGSIEVGKRPGLAVIEGVDFEAMRLTDESRARRIV